MLTADLSQSRRQMINMTPRGVGQKIGTGTNKSCAKKFVFPPEDEKKVGKPEKG